MFSAVDEAPSNSQGSSWTLTVYAICMISGAFDDYTIVNHAEDRSSSAFQTSAVRCPPGTVAYGAGGSINTPDGVPSPGCMGLQLVRTSGPLDIGRATAREDAQGYDGDWILTSYAICATPRGSIHAEAEVPPNPLATQATHVCSSDNWVRGIGGGGGLIDDGPVFLRTLIPIIDGMLPVGVVVELTNPLNSSVGGMVAHPTCASGF